MQQENGNSTATIKDKEAQTTDKNKKNMGQKNDERSSEASSESQDKDVSEDEDQK